MCNQYSFLRRTFSRGVNRTGPLSMLCAHSHNALIISASAYSSMAFLSYVCFVLFSICRQITCLFTQPDIARLTVASTRHPMYRRSKVDRESAHRPSQPNRHNTTRWPSTRVQRVGYGRSHPRARRIIRPATIRICGGSSARDVRM